MADNKAMRGGQDRSRINIYESYEVQYWKEKFDITADELRDAVAAVGTSAADVEQYLQSKRGNA
ncbi:hypothetical protein VF13_41155 [Nostoc linckia z16]|nr:hypothetical protein VF13_41155 [Nostoc linckia z16]